MDAALAREVVTDHARRRRGHVPALTDAFDVSHRQVSPLCGDEIEVGASVRDGVVTGLAWSAEGCSISQAAASVLHDVAVGAPLGTVLAAVEHYRAMVTSRGAIAGDERIIGDGVAFAGVGRHLSRVNCAMLGWVALEQALQAVEETSRQEQAG